MRPDRLEADSNEDERRLVFFKLTNFSNTEDLQTLKFTYTNSLAVSLCEQLKGELFDRVPTLETDSLSTYLLKLTVC